ncbi:MAG: hypothetical protein ABW023_14815 [Sphingomonas sp.]
MTTQLDPKPISSYRLLGSALARPIAPAPTKVAREDMMVLRVTADIGPEVCAEILAVLEREDVVAHSIAFTREAKRLLIEISIHDLAEDHTRILPRKIRALPEVRTATLTTYEAEE